MMEYKIINSGTNGILAEILSDRVNEHIAAGWKPQGGMAIDAWEQGVVFYQAMIRNTQTEVPNE